MEDAIVVRRVVEFLDAETDFTSSFDYCCLCSSSRFGGIPSTAHFCHVSIFELAIDRGFFAVVAVWIGVFTFCGSYVSIPLLDSTETDEMDRKLIPNIFEFRGFRTIQNEMGKVIWHGN